LGAALCENLETGKMELNQIIIGDCRELIQGVTEASVDLIFTDPPWDDASLPLYEWLAHASARVLKEGSFVLAYCGNARYPDILGYFGAAGLTYFDTFCGVQLNSDDMYFHKKLFMGWRPIVVYSRGEAQPINWVPNAAYTNRDKRYHPWGQGVEPIRRWINGLSRPGDLVLDPFCGGGATAAVCIELGRNYLTFEIDPQTAEVARRRLATTQPPLFVLPGEQQLEIFKS